MRFDDYLNEDANTDFLETCSCVGIVCPSSLVHDLKLFIDTESGDAVKLLSQIQKIVGTGGYDWVPKGVSAIKSLDVQKNTKKVYVCFNVVVGMGMFMNEVGSNVVGSKPYFINNSIKDYYKKEIFVWGKIPHTKDNTADVIISSTKNILASIDMGSNADPTSQYIENSDGSKYIQVSLKKDADAAQLGKVTKIMKSIFDVDTTTNARKKFTLSEGVLDYIKKLGSRVFKGIQGIINNFSQKIKKKFGKPNKKHLADLMSSLSINEKKMTISVSNMLDAVLMNPSNLIESVNTELSKLSNMMKSTDTPHIIIPNKRINVKSGDDVLKLISNYLTIRLIQDMMKDKVKLTNNINRIIGEMYFGGTKLPLWKVFGYFKTSSYHYMGTLDVFSDKQIDLSVDPFAVKITPKDNFYVIYMFMLEDVGEKGKTYVRLRTGTNSSSSVTFIVEGTQTLGPYPLDMDINDIID